MIAKLAAMLLMIPVASNAAVWTDSQDRFPEVPALSGLGSVLERPAGWGGGAPPRYNLATPEQALQFKTSIPYDKRRNAVFDVASGDIRLPTQAEKDALSAYRSSVEQANQSFRDRVLALKEKMAGRTATFDEIMEAVEKLITFTVGGQ